MQPHMQPYVQTHTHTQGYKIIGSHSAVKLCRWTKSMLRGRGGCYKHTLYGRFLLLLCTIMFAPHVVYQSHTQPEVHHTCAIQLHVQLHIQLHIQVHIQLELHIQVHIQLQLHIQLHTPPTSPPPHPPTGIESHRCMEMTPSLACSNKCVFCWRHHTNPVGRGWSGWKMDDPQMIVEGAVEQHVKMINAYKGVPGVLPGRIQEGFEVCDGW